MGVDGSGTKSYHAFISYAHAQEQVLAGALERDVRRFARPWNRQWAIRVYRDESNLSVSPDLWGKVQTALLDSRHLILSASPEAAKSKWVARELNAFLDGRGSDKLLIVLTAGEIAWDDSAGDFDYDSESMSYKLGWGFMHNDNDYWMSICHL